MLNENYCELCRYFSRFQGFDGWVIGMASAGQIQDGKMPDTGIIKQRKSTALLRSCLRVSDKVFYIEIQLFKPDRQMQLYGRKNTDVDLRFVFSHKEIYEFVDKTGDYNEIHRGDSPVVPGLLILWRLYRYLEKNGESTKQIKVKFVTSGIAGQEINLHLDVSRQIWEVG